MDNQTNKWLDRYEARRWAGLYDLERMRTVAVARQRADREQRARLEKLAGQYAAKQQCYLAMAAVAQ